MTTTAEKEVVLDEVLNLVEAWQKKGRFGYCMPVLSGSLLKALEQFADARRRENCTWCEGTGKIPDYEDRVPCGHCEPLSA